jgi:PleD family two-component response regulator
LQGFTVEFCTGGFHILSFVEQYLDTHLVIIHENMEDMPAYEIISLIRTHKNKLELPIIYITKKQTEDGIQEVVAAGANEFIVQTPGLQVILDKTKKYFTHMLTA